MKRLPRKVVSSQSLGMCKLRWEADSMVAGGILSPMRLDADQISYKLPSRSINPEAFKRVANYCSPKAGECCYPTPTVSPSLAPGIVGTQVANPLENCFLAESIRALEIQKFPPQPHGKEEGNEAWSRKPQPAPERQPSKAKSWTYLLGTSCRCLLSFSFMPSSVKGVTMLCCMVIRVK